MTNTYGSDRSMTREWERPTRWSDMTNISMSGIADTLRDKPEAFLLLAAGAALLMRGRGFGSTAQARPSYGTSSTYQGMARGTGTERGMGAQQTGGGTGSMRDMQERAGSAASDTMNRARDAASDTMGRARDVASDTMGRARDVASDTMGRARGAMDDTMESVRSYSSDFADRMSRSTGDVGRMARERVGSGLDMLTDNPLLLALCGASAGILAASMLPRTDIEDQALRGVRRQVSDFAEQAQGNLAEAFSEATDTLREETQRRGLTGEGLKDVASKVAGAFTETVTGGSSDTGSTSSGSSTGGTGSSSNSSHTGAGTSQSGSTAGATSGMGGSYGGPSGQSGQSGLGGIGSASSGTPGGSAGTGSGSNTPVSTSATAGEASGATGASAGSSGTGASLGGTQSSNATGSVGGGSTSTNPNAASNAGKGGGQGKGGQGKGASQSGSSSPAKTS